MFSVLCSRFRVSDSTSAETLNGQVNNQEKSITGANLVQKLVRQTDFLKNVLGFGNAVPSGYLLYPTMRAVLPVFLSCLLLTACTNPAEQNLPPVYYDVAGFMNKQIDDLSARKPAVQKSVSVDNKQSRQTTADINWSRELGLFTQADINKPALRNSYQTERPDSLTYIYTLKPTEERLTVRSLTVQLAEITRKPQRIEAVLQTDNPLYTSERHLFFERKPGSESIHYTITGFQKLAYATKRDFMVEGRVK